MVTLKKGLLLLLLLLAGLLCCGCVNDDVPKERIISFVAENQEKLNAYVENLPEDSEALEAVFRKQVGRRTIVESIDPYGDGILDFYCGGTGLSTNSTYSGFYWSESDTPFTFEFHAEDQLKETEPGVFFWNSGGGEEIRAERILPCWFWYHIVWN